MPKVIDSISIRLFFICSLTVLTGCAPPPVEKPNPGSGEVAAVIGYGQALIRQLMEKDDVPGVSVVLVKDQQIVWAEGFGWASIDDALPLTQETAMRLASVTKVLTATAIMQLEERGLLKLDAPITDYLPEFSIQSRFPTDTITVRQLLTHHAGLPSDLMQGFKLYTGEGVAPGNLLDQFRNLPTASSTLHLGSEPGMVFSYSNLGYGLLGSVVERISGENYWDYISHNILSPLGMTNSAIVHPGYTSGIAYANGFTENGEINHRYIRDISAGGLAASAMDMGRFLMLLQGAFPNVLSSSSIAEMNTPQNESVELDGDFRVGLAFFLSPDDQEPAVASHRGDGFPYHSTMQIMPAEDLGIVVMTNSSSGQSLVNQAASQIMDVAYQSTTELRFESETKTVGEEGRVNLTEAQARSYVGQYYAGPDLGIVEVRSKGRTLSLDFHQTRLADAKLIPMGDDKFDIRLRFLGLIPLPMSLVLGGQDAPHFQLQFEMISNQRHLWLTTNGLRGNFPLAVPLAPFSVPTAWLNRVGKYRVLDTKHTLISAAELSFDKRSGYLMIRFENDILYPRYVPVVALSDESMAVAGFGRFGGEVIEVLDTGSLLYSGVRLDPVH